MARPLVSTMENVRWFGIFAAVLVLALQSRGQDGQNYQQQPEADDRQGDHLISFIDLVHYTFNHHFNRIT